ncbi:MAG: hypothetical protein E6R03_07425 [Hyphomicrobiaceae bacterium]|nr:MAG: hypothetical protein E6R03_07425 [Hyphomicrobiaceae bacterium]
MTTIDDQSMIFVEADPAEVEAAAAALLQQQMALEALASGLWADLNQRKRLRMARENEWINAEYAYEGVYTPDQAKELTGTKIFVNITRPKTNAFHAHLSDMLMPGGDDRCWGVDASPKPVLSQLSGDKTPIGTTEQGAQVQMGDLVAGITEEAKKRAKAMQLLCEDQLAQSKYNAEFRKALFYGAKLGTIIMRGPTVSATIKTMWKQVHGAVYEQVPANDRTNPEFGAVNPFHFYPEPFARHIDESEKNFETFFLTGRQLRKMAKAGWDADAIAEVLEAEERMGTPPDWYTRVAQIANASNSVGTPYEGAQPVKGLYEVWLCTCDLSGKELTTLFPDADPQLDSLPVSIWGIGHKIIKAEVNPLEVDCIYSVAQFIENETSLFGHGLPWAGANPQESLNAAWRMIIDNGAAAAIPNVAVFKSRIVPADGQWAYTPGKTWYVSRGPDGEDQDPDVRKFIQFLDVPVKLNDLMAILKTAKEMFDEEVAFSLVMQGVTGPYTPETAGATNTHYNSGRIVLRRVVSNIDDNITVPNIGRLIDWNMMFSTDESVKGDLQPIAKGSAVLMERSEQLMALKNFMPLLLNPAYRHKIDGDKVIDQVVTNLRITDVLRSEEESKKIAQEMQQQAQQGQPADPAKMAMVEVAKGKLQLEAQKHKDDVAMEQNYLQIAMKELGLTEHDLMTKAGITKMQIDAANQRFNSEMAAKLRTGHGI